MEDGGVEDGGVEDSGGGGGVEDGGVEDGGVEENMAVCSPEQTIIIISQPIPQWELNPRHWD